MRYLIGTLIVAALDPVIIGCLTTTDTETNPITGRKTAAMTDCNRPGPDRPTRVGRADQPPSEEG